MFLGEYQHTLDAKGRLSLPAKFRNQMSGSYVVAKGLEGCLYVYSPEDYANFLAQLTASGDFDAKHRQVRRFFTAGAKEDELDSAGRVNVPANLRDYATLEREVTVIGNDDRIELWNSEAWAAYNGETESRIEEVTSELAELGLL